MQRRSEQGDEERIQKPDYGFWRRGIFDCGAIHFAHLPRSITATQGERVTVHARRQKFASLLIAAPVNAEVLSTYMGHTTIEITHRVGFHRSASD